MDLARLKIAFLSPRTVVAAAISVCAAAGGFLVLGPGFSLVLVPLVAGMIVAFRIHKDRLSIKTAEIIGANRIHQATIEALATAIDARDQVGSGHVRRTQVYALGLGEAIGLSDAEMSALRTGALLHDIGKLAVPDHILSKPDNLTPAELEKAKTHAAVGAAILSEIDFPYPVVPTVKYHHESWDGTGYPHGLAGTDIPVTSRVLAIADTYDALRSDRPYRKARDRDEARRQIAAAAGLKFDPHIVQVFLKNLSAFEERAAALGLHYAGDEAAAVHSSSGFVEQIKQANREVFTLFELTREFGESDNLHDMCSTLSRNIGQFVPFDTCAIFLLDETRTVASSVHVEGKNKAILQSKRFSAGEGATGVVLKRREPVVNVNPDLDFSVSQLELIQEYATMASFPLIADGGQLIGAVSVYTSTVAKYQEEHLRILETITRIAAGAIAKLQDHVLTKAHALTDPMTGLPNARSLQMQFEREVSRANRGDTKFHMLMLDLDGFKAVNDNFGHKVGDKVLRDVGQVIQAQLREYDFLGRYGGDEFMALVPMDSSEDVSDLCRRIEKAVAAFRLPVGDKFASVGVSLGAALYPGNGETFDQMIVSSDRMMYKRKSGRKVPRPARAVVPETQMSLDEILSAGHAYLPERANHGQFVVELDESAVVSNAIN